VRYGDFFYADVAFLKDAVEGNVKYSVLIQQSNANAQSIAELPHSYGAGIKLLQADLSAYAGQQLTFVLRVDAGANANYDWACWLRAVIYRYP
ncbi:MAG: hypothetical protein P1S60_18925, partial [Anaerolineae bacterium]|nr:hypothetical protein [Anaerolineae bacterium]